RRRRYRRRPYRAPARRRVWRGRNKPMFPCSRRRWRHRRRSRPPPDKIVQRHVDVTGEILREHHFGDAGFEMALPEMAGDADQAVLLLIPRKGDAIIRLKARLISSEDGGAVLLFEDH